jgi:hypothetical protein
LAAREAAQAEAARRSEELKTDWQKHVDRAIGLLKEIGAENIEPPKYVEGASSTSILFTVGTVPLSLTIQRTAISLYISQQFVAQFAWLLNGEEVYSEYPEATPETVADALAIALVAYSEQLGIEIVQPPKRRRNATQEAQS